MNIYEDFYHQGKSLTEWQKDFKGEYSLGELYRMAKDGTDFSKLILIENGIISKN